MNSKVLASLILVSFAMIFLGVFAEGFENFFYGAGAIGTMIFIGLGLSRLFTHDKKDWFPYLGGVVLFVFWSYAFIAPDGLGLLALPYMISGLYTAIKLYRV